MRLEDTPRTLTHCIEATSSSVGDSGFTVLNRVDKLHYKMHLTTIRLGTKKNSVIPKRIKETSTNICVLACGRTQAGSLETIIMLSRDLTTRPLFKDTKHTNQTVGRLRSNYIEIPLALYVMLFEVSKVVNEDRRGSTGFCDRARNPVDFHRCASSQPRYAHTVPRSNGQFKCTV